MRVVRRCVRFIVVLAIAAFFGVTYAERYRMAGSAIRPNAPTVAESRVDAEQLMADVTALASREFAGRLTGSDGSHRARALIRERFQQLGLEPVGAGFEQTFSFTHRSLEGLVLPSRRFNSRFAGATNVMGWLEGTAERDRVVLVTAHYDHLGVVDGRWYPGADDNASGVAAMLAAASWFRRHPPKQSILFVAFDAEEQGLQGSRYFVRRPPFDLERVTAVINLDMIGRDDENTLVVAGTYYSPHLKPLVVEAAHGRQITVVFGHDRPFVTAANVDDWTWSSDHGPFHAAGIPFLYFGVEDHADYHQPTDTAENIRPPFFLEATNLVIETVRRVADGPGAPRRAE